MSVENLAEVEHDEVTRLCAQTALALMQHGAETALVESVPRRLAAALGVEIQVAFSINAITVTTSHAGGASTAVLRSVDRGINVHVLVEVQQVMLDVEAGRLDRAGALARISAIKPFRYPRWLVALGIGLSCACFARLTGTNVPGCAVVLVASAVAMVTRQLVAHRHFSPLITFFVASFVVTSIAANGTHHQSPEQARLAVAASVLLLVPGFPLINGVSDMVKGFVDIGVTRLVVALLLAMATISGITLALRVWGFWSWF